MDHLSDVSTVPLEDNVGDLQEDTQETGAVNSEPIELGSIDPSDSSSAESTDQEMMDASSSEPESSEPESSESESLNGLNQTAQSTPARVIEQTPTSTGGSSTIAKEPAVSNASAQQPKTGSAVSITQNASTATTAKNSGPESIPPRKRTELDKVIKYKRYDPEEPYDPDEPEDLRYFGNCPRINFEKAYTIAERRWASVMSSVNRRLSNKARPWTELEDVWKHYLKYAGRLWLRARKPGYLTRDAYLQMQKAALMSFAMSITPRMLCYYVQCTRSPEKHVFFEALIRRNGGKILPKE